MHNLEKNIRRIQQHIETHQRNLNYLEEQEARYGPLSVPLELHNKLVKERETLASLVLQLERLQRLRKRPAAETGARIGALARADVPTAAAVDNDVYWHGIIAEVATAFSLPTEGYTVNRMVAHLREFLRAGHRVAIVGLPTPSEFSRTLNLNSWTRAIVAVSSAIPTILLTTREARPVTIATRYALQKHNITNVATMQKETFTYEWFTKILKKALEESA